MEFSHWHMQQVIKSVPPCWLVKFTIHCLFSALTFYSHSTFWCQTWGSFNAQEAQIAIFQLLVKYLHVMGRASQRSVISCQGTSRLKCNCQYLKVFLFISANAENKHCQFTVNSRVCIIFKDDSSLKFCIAQNTWHSVRFSVSSLGLIMPCVKNQATALPSGPFEINQKLPLKSLRSNGDSQVKKTSLSRTTTTTVVKNAISEFPIWKKQGNTNGLSMRRIIKAQYGEPKLLFCKMLF